MKKAAAYRLSDEALNLIREIAERRGTSRTAVVEEAIRAYAVRLENPHRKRSRFASQPE